MAESNVYNVSQYSDRLVAMVAEWRRKWGRNFPFYFTQIAPFDYTTWNVPSEVGEHVGAYLRDEQRKSMDRIENSGMRSRTNSSGTQRESWRTFRIDGIS